MTLPPAVVYVGSMNTFFSTGPSYANAGSAAQSHAAANRPVFMPAHIAFMRLPSVIAANGSAGYWLPYKSSAEKLAFSWQPLGRFADNRPSIPWAVTFSS